MKNTTYKKILLTHDGSSLASAAIPHAVSLAKTYNAEVILLHVIEPYAQNLEYISTPGSGIGYPVIVEDNLKNLYNENLKKTDTEMKRIQKEMMEKDTPSVKICIEEGIAKDAIIDISKKEKCDIIVMSTHGRSGIVKLFLGSVADFVIRKSNCPVLLIHPNT